MEGKEKNCELTIFYLIKIFLRNKNTFADEEEQEKPIIRRPVQWSPLKEILQAEGQWYQIEIVPIQRIDNH